MEFVDDSYRELLGGFLEGTYRVVTVRQAATEITEPPILILRHDVEWSAERALALASIEQSLGVRSTLYFRLDTKANDAKAMKRLQEDGFDIGYHYNALDRARGDFARAAEMFERDIDYLRRSGIEVMTATSHGNPRVKRVGYKTNSDLMRWDPSLYERSGLIDLGPYTRHFDRLSFLLCVSDANLHWNHGQIRRRFLSRLIREHSVPAIFMLVHSDYWSRHWPRAVALRVVAFGLRSLRLNSIIAWGRHSASALSASTRRP